MKKNIDDSKLFSLAGKVILLTGATGHLGREIAFGVSQADTTLILCSRNHATLNELAEQLKGSKAKIIVFPADLRDFENTKKGLHEILDSLGKLNIIINNAHQGSCADIESTDIKFFNRDYEIAVTAAFNIIQTSLPYLKKGASSNNHASIINVASMYGMVSPDPRIYVNGEGNNPPYYGPAKAGLIQLTRYLACHLAEDYIRVNSISPGPFPPESLKSDNPNFYQSLCKKNPMNRIGQAHELIGPILFLASQASSYVTGINLPVDGGWTAW